MAAPKQKGYKQKFAPTSPSECGKAIRAKEYSNLYLFYGRDTGALDPFVKKLTERLCPKEAQVMNLHTFDAGDQLDMEALADAVQVLPMFAERVVVTLSGLDMDSLPPTKADILRKLIEDIPETTVLMLIAGGEKPYKNRRSLSDKNQRFFEKCQKFGTVVEFAFKSVYEQGKMITAAVKNNGCSISQRDAEYIAQLCLCDTASIAMETEKLCAYANGGTIEREAIDALVIRKVESDGFTLAVNILRGNAAFVFARLTELRAQNYEPMQILSVINMSLADIYRARLARSAGRTDSDCAKDFGYPKNREFAVRKAYDDCMSIDPDRLRRTLTLLSDTELRMKTSSMNDAAAYLAVEQFAASSMA
ncbi:DNA polymerase III, delta subunit [Ruminococcus sp. YE71]|uniref:DNA polymerase III subunit delta n=1 Tax=unclassified Ruminococcus TaxID=2608920 RepID=UPI00088CBE2D|nr:MULTISPECIES: DNA polymerase III subunit delta [unclassified Ruminococcus]SDA15813.1 DNA polymerase III, delta subunit [Ruminococcus sp. YE78]SFW23234.1 DNA polymerase III, delta subunit [Ruminococcus sp. YE71]